MWILPLVGSRSTSGICEHVGTRGRMSNVGTFLFLLLLLPMSEDRWGENKEKPFGPPSQPELTAHEDQPGPPDFSFPTTLEDFRLPSPGGS